MREDAMTISLGSTVYLSKHPDARGVVTALVQDNAGNWADVAWPDEPVTIRHPLTALLEAASDAGVTAPPTGLGLTGPITARPVDQALTTRWRRLLRGFAPDIRTVQAVALAELEPRLATVHRELTAGQTTLNPAGTITEALSIIEATFEVTDAIWIQIERGRPRAGGLLSGRRFRKR
ncbi:hypothetical protein; putative Lycopene beta-cyclase domain [Frankia alni ACN14a]|uniref:Uncharacterized protein n=2 Tax=Frankiaceae TaxID=74712 RepID=Q0RM44_FRAAA|nr:hypothetical protein; putative Lycopene beta-cyclase domain [Frankia alni ACN14a]